MVVMNCWQGTGLDLGTSMIAGPVAGIPLACGRLEMGLWPCGRLNTMVAGPVAVLSEYGFGWGRGRRR